jgi:gliding motility-associated-like protein
MRTGGGFMRLIIGVVSMLLLGSLDICAQSFQNASLESWGGSGTCLINTVPDSWLSYTTEGADFDECDFAFCGSTIPAQAAEGTSYGRAYSGSVTSGEGIAQVVAGFVPGTEYQVSFEFAGSNLLPGFNASQWHVFLDDVDVDQTIAFSSTEMQWSTHVFSFIATGTSHLFGFRACTAAASGGSAAIDNFQIQDLTPVVPVFPVAGFVSSEQVLCMGECAVFANNSQFETEVSWIFESGSPASSQSTSEVEVCYNQPGVFLVEMIAANGDGTDTLQQWVTVVANPTGSLNHLGDSLLLSTDVGIGDFNWTLDGVLLPESGYLLTPLESGLYQVNLQNEAACSASLDVWVTAPAVLAEPEAMALWIPNAITFGDDGVNDVWGVYGELSRLESIRTQVFDRWGEQVFETNESTGRWTGAAFGGSHYVPDGIYLYIVLVKWAGEIEPRRYQGHITVIR